MMKTKKNVMTLKKKTTRMISECPVAAHIAVRLNFRRSSVGDCVCVYSLCVRLPVHTVEYACGTHSVMTADLGEGCVHGDWEFDISGVMQPQCSAFLLKNVAPKYAQSSKAS